MAKKKSRRVAKKKARSRSSAVAKKDFTEFDPKAVSKFEIVETIQQMAKTYSGSIEGIAVDKDFFEAKKELKKFVRGLKATAPQHAVVSQMSSTVTSGGIENIRGVSIGLRRTKYGFSGEIAAKVFVAHKLPESQLDKNSIVPKNISGIATDVEETNEINQQAPVRMGSVCSPQQTPQPNGGVFVGTMGCLVVLNNDKLALLSNNHVLALNNSLPVGTPIWHPSQLDGDKVQIGVLESFVPIRFGSMNENAENPVNRVDAAVAWTSTQFVSPNHVSYTMDPTPVAPQLNMSVVKHGQRTGNTSGVITDITYDTVVHVDNHRWAWYDDQIKIVGVGGGIFSLTGDSGSLIVTAGSKQPVALLHAGADGQFTVASPIQAVMQEVGIKRFYAG